MNSLSIRATSRLVCAAGSLLSLTLLTGFAFVPSAQARQGSGQPAVALNSVSVPTHFTSGQSVSVTIGLSGASASVTITSRPAGIVNYTGTATDGVALSVPTTAINTNGQAVPVTLVVKSGGQTVEVETEASRIDLEPIFPKPVSASSYIDLEPIFPKKPGASSYIDLEPIFPKKPTTTFYIDLEPIFPKPVSASSYIDLEPIFPKPSTAGSYIDLEPIFPKPTASTYIDLEPIFPKSSAAAWSSRFRTVVTPRTARRF